MRSLLIFLFTISIAQAQTLIISDIDDTIKVSNVRSKVGLAANALRTENIFLGMADIYKAIIDKKDAKVFYLSNAFESLMLKPHTELLRNGKFPKGKLILRRIGTSSSDHKLGQLSKIIKEHNPENVILFGDNGQSDFKYYETIRSKFTQVNFITFIRTAYDVDDSNTLFQGQYGFVSPHEVANILAKKWMIFKTARTKIYQEHTNSFLMNMTRRGQKGRMYIPKWLRCNGHHVEYQEGLPDKLVNAIFKLCNI